MQGSLSDSNGDSCIKKTIIKDMTVESKSQYQLNSFFFAAITCDQLNDIAAVINGFFFIYTFLLGEHGENVCNLL